MTDAFYIKLLKPYASELNVSVQKLMEKTEPNNLTLKLKVAEMLTYNFSLYTIGKVLNLPLFYLEKHFAPKGIVVNIKEDVEEITKDVTCFTIEGIKFLYKEKDGKVQCL